MAQVCIGYFPIRVFSKVLVAVVIKSIVAGTRRVVAVALTKFPGIVGESLPD